MRHLKRTKEAWRLDGYYHISYKLLRAIQTKEKKRKFSLRYYDGKFYGVFCTSSSNLYGSKSCVCHIVHKKAFQKSPKVMKSWFVMTQQYIINMFSELYLYYKEVKTYYRRYQLGRTDNEIINLHHAITHTTYFLYVFWSLLYLCVVSEIQFWKWTTTAKKLERLNSFSSYNFLFVLKNFCE